MTITLKEKDFKRLSGFIQSEFGIKMPEAKKILVESRLQKRLRNLEIDSFKDYCEYLFSPEGRIQEIPHFISKITTNKTDFFREPEHFNYLTNHALPDILAKQPSLNKNLSVWSAGCSTGEEPYTLAIVLDEYRQKYSDLALKYSILATDISPEVIMKGKAAIYKESLIEQIPLALKRNYFMRSKDRNTAVVKIVPEIRNTVQFQQLNFMDQDYRLKAPVDMIFFRNVMIYFDRPTQQAILSKLCRYLKTGGYFFQGHSESLQGMDLPLTLVAPTIYKKI